MAETSSLPFQSFILALGNGANPEVFAPVGAYISRSLKGKLETGSTQVPDATNDAALYATELEGKSITFEITAEGLLAMGSASDAMRTWFMSGLPKNVQLQHAATAANGGGMYSGAAYLTDYGEDAKKAEKTTVSITISSSGYWNYTPAAS